jgi:nicotinamide mononucleotide transporter
MLHNNKKGLSPLFYFSIDYYLLKQYICLMLLQIISGFATILSVVLMSKEKSSGWIWGIIGAVAFLFIYMEQKLYLQAGLQIVFVLQSIYGIWNWRRLSNTNLAPSTKLINSLKYFGGVFILSFVVSMVYGTFTNVTFPFIDTWTTAMCILANFWLINKRVEGWAVWAFVNIILFFVFFINKYYISSLLEMLLFIISLSNYMQWLNRKK